MACNKVKYSQTQLPLVTRIKVCILALARYFYIRRDGTINRRVFSLIDFKAPAPRTKRVNTTTNVSTSDITIDQSRNLWFRLFTPSSTSKEVTSSYESLPLIVYYHGGGFTTYGPDSEPYDKLCSLLAAEAPAVVSSINYRLAPEYRYPIQYKDGFDSLKFIDGHNHNVLPANTDMTRCFIAGDSAGGNIAHHITLKASENSNKFKEIKVIGLLGLQPFFGGEERVESELRLKKAPILNVESTDWMWRCFLPEGADRNYHAARVFGDGKSSEATEKLKSSGFPKALVVMGGHDPLQDWQKKYVEWLENCGKEVEVLEYPNTFHGFYGFPEVAEFDLVVKDVTKFIREQAHCN